MIVDAHHHIWRQADLPWLKGPMQPRIFGRYEPIRKDYRIEDYLADIKGLGISRSVYVQANWAPEQYLDEAAYVQETADEHGWPHAMVAFADLTVEDARPQLDALAKFPLVRGIRQQLHWHDIPMYRFAQSPNLARDPVLQRNIGHLADYGWVFDLQLFPTQMAGGAELAAACPDVTFILQHAGMLVDRSAQGWMEWRAAMAELAARPNASCKLSGFGTFVHEVDQALITALWRETLALFGADRCLWGSNFPIEKLWASYGKLLGAHQEAAAMLTEADRQKIFERNARRIYRA